MSSKFSFTALYILGALLAALYILAEYKQNSFSQQKRIAIITPTTQGEFHSTVIEAFLKKMVSSNKNYTIKIFDANGVDKVLLAAMTEEAIENNFDLFLTVGTMASQTAKTVRKKHGNTIPQVFTGAGDPLKTGLAETLASPGTKITGIEIAPASNITGVKILLKTKPYMKHLLVPYWLHGKGGELEDEAFEIRDLLAQHSIKVTPVPVSNIGEVIPRLSAFSEEADTIMYLDGCVTQEAVSGLVKLCNQNNITLFACNLAGVRKGAAAGYGSDIENLGYESFAIADHILSQDTPPDTIPIKILSQAHRLGVNKKTMFTQGLTFPAERADLLRDAVIYDTIEDTDD